MENPALAVSTGIQMAPILGDFYSFFTGFIGYDPIAGIHLSSEERTMAMYSAVVLGGGFHLLGRFADEVPWSQAGVGAIRQADELGAGLRVGCDLAARTRVVAGRPPNRRLIARDPGVRPVDSLCVPLPATARQPSPDCGRAQPERRRVAAKPT